MKTEKMEIRFLSRYKLPEILHVSPKKLTFESGRNFLRGKVGESGFSFELGERRKKTVYICYRYEGSFSEEGAKTEFRGEVCKTQEMRKADLIYDGVILGAFVVLSGVAAYLGTHKALWTILVPVVMLGVGLVSNFLSRKREKKEAFAAFSAYFKQVFRAEPVIEEKKKK